jgi:hypothetical protein
MSVVPVTQEEFQMVQNPNFLTFLNAFGIRRVSNPRGCLQVAGNITPETFGRVVKQLMETWLPKYAEM